MNFIQFLSKYLGLDLDIIYNVNFSINYKENNGNKSRRGINKIIKTAIKINNQLMYFAVKLQKKKMNATHQSLKIIL